MGVITIPKKLVERDDLVVIPRREYETLIMLRNHREFAPTKEQKQALIRAERNLNRGKTFSYGTLLRKLGFRN